MFVFVASPKIKMINVRLKPLVHEEFKIACDLRGASMSSLMHQFIVRTIREEKELSPQTFKVLQSERFDDGKNLNGIPGQPLAPHSKKKIPFIIPKPKEKKVA